jgi:hypothetical protein
MNDLVAVAATKKRAACCRTPFTGAAIAFGFKHNKYENGERSDDIDIEDKPANIADL